MEKKLFPSHNSFVFDNLFRRIKNSAWYQEPACRISSENITNWQSNEGLKFWKGYSHRPFPLFSTDSKDFLQVSYVCLLMIVDAFLVCMEYGAKSCTSVNLLVCLVCWPHPDRVEDITIPKLYEPHMFIFSWVSN